MLLNAWANLQKSGEGIGERPPDLGIIFLASVRRRVRRAGAVTVGRFCVQG